VHPQHNPVVACGGIKRGQEHRLRTNSRRKRVNINDAIDLERREPIVRFDETVNAPSTIALFQELERINLVATWIYVICGNAPCYRARVLADLAHQARVSARLGAEPQSHRATMEVFQTERELTYR
jgi:hypothetical protein